MQSLRTALRALTLALVTALPASAQGLDLTINHVGLGIGAVPRVTGLRLNYSARRLARVDGVALGVFCVGARERIRGIGVGALGIGANELEGIMVGGLGAGTGGDFTGLGVGGLGVGSGGSLRGIFVGGLGAGSGQDVTGI